MPIDGLNGREIAALAVAGTAQLIIAGYALLWWRAKVRAEKTVAAKDAEIAQLRATPASIDVDSRHNS